MKIVSFAWTTPALLAGHKTVTRRQWKESHARSIYVGDHLHAYDRSPRVHGKPVAVIEITRDPYLEHTANMPDDDYDHEGFAYLNALAEQWLATHRLDDALTSADLRVRRYYEVLREDTSRGAWLAWKEKNEPLWVVRFRMVKLL